MRQTLSANGARSAPAFSRALCAHSRICCAGSVSRLGARLSRLTCWPIAHMRVLVRIVPILIAVGVD